MQAPLCTVYRVFWIWLECALLSGDSPARLRRGGKEIHVKGRHIHGLVRGRRKFRGIMCHSVGTAESFRHAQSDAPLSDPTHLALSWPRGSSAATEQCLWGGLASVSGLPVLVTGSRARRRGYTRNLAGDPNRNVHAECKADSGRARDNLVKMSRRGGRRQE